MSFQVGVGLSDLPDTRAALNAAIPAAMAQAGLSRADWAICFFTMAHLPRGDLVQETILRETGCRALFGCSAAGLITGARELEDSPGLVLMVGETPGLEARSALLGGDGAGLAALTGPERLSAGKQLVFGLPDAYRVDAARLLDELRGQQPGLPFYGAGATDNGAAGMSLQLGMEGVRSNAVAALGFSGEMEYAVGITQSCEPVGEPHFVTAFRDNVMLELDGRPAIYPYIDQGKALDLVDFQELVEELLLGFPLDSVNPSFSGESCLVRHLIGFDQQAGGLIVPQNLDGQSAMSFMHRNADKAEQDMHRMVSGLKESMSGPPDFGIYFDCAARGKRLYGRDGVDTGVIRQALGNFPLIGMLGGFEMATSASMPLLYTYTGVLVLIRCNVA